MEFAKEGSYRRNLKNEGLCIGFLVDMARRNDDDAKQGAYLCHLILCTRPVEVLMQGDDDDMEMLHTRCEGAHGLDQCISKCSDYELAGMNAQCS
ncbi:unnamed protein product [Lathyrus oleraceus]